jgi:hypothetical protein
MTTLTAPRRNVPTYTDTGRNRVVYADTGRPVDEDLGSHILLWIVDDADAWATAIETEADAELASAPKSARHLAQTRHTQRYESAAKVRADGPGRTWYSHYHTPESAEAAAADLRRAHPNPGVRYEVAAITDTGACPDCHQPTVEADGQWRHHLGRYPAACITHPEPIPDPEPADGEWAIDTGRGYMICGYCGDRATWAATIIGHVTLTGFHALAVHRETGELVVIAEATTLTGAPVILPHHCADIPDDVRAEYADDVQAILANSTS